MRKPCVLVVQFRTDAESVAFEQRVFQRALRDDVDLRFVDIFNDLEPWAAPKKLLTGCDGVVFGGSGELFFDGRHAPGHAVRALTDRILERAAPLVEYVFAYDVPTLGICFGHQLIAMVRKAPVVFGKECSKAGTFQVRSTVVDHPLLSGLPEVFQAQYGHKDIVAKLPEGATAVATGDLCAFAMLSYGPHIHTTQFHPELNDADIRLRLAKNPEYLPEGKHAHEIVLPSPHATKILVHFFSLVRKSVR